MSTGFDTGGFDVEPFDAEAGLGLLPNAFLDRPSVVWAFDLYLTSSFPITFPWTFDAAPFRFSTVDFYPGGLLGDVLYEARLLEVPVVSRQAPDVFGGIDQVDAVRMRLEAAVANSPVLDLHIWVTAEHRGKVIVGHLVELDRAFAAVTIQQDVFRGEVTALADDPSTVSLLARAFDLASFTELVPATRVSTAWAAYALSGALGRVVPFGIGIGRRIPCVPVKVGSDEDTLFERTFTADPALDRLTVFDHEFETGRGPFQVSSTGTLPGGLLPNVDYWLIVATDADDEVLLATTPGNAVTGVNVDLANAGTGTHTIRTGTAPNLSPEYDLVVGTGNLGIVRVWEDETGQGAGADEGIPDVPVDYTIQHRTYRPGGRYCTSIQFPDDMSDVEISADVLRVYPDVDGDVVAEWKWLTGWHDDVGGLDAISAPTAPMVLTTAALTATHQRFGLGGVTLNGDQGLEVPGSAAVWPQQTFTLELEAIPAARAAGSRILAVAPNWVATGPAWILWYYAPTSTVFVDLRFVDGTVDQVTAPAGSTPAGLPFRVTFQHDATTGTSSLFVGRTLVDTVTRASALSYSPSGQSVVFGTTGAFGGASGFQGVLGFVRISKAVRPQRYVDNAYWLWRRNGVEFLRELAADAGRLVNAASFDAAAQAWDAIEGGTLHCDGFMVDENELRAVFAAMVPFRDLAFTVGDSTLLEVTLAQPPTVIRGVAGFGDDYANLLAYPTRTGASLTEVPRGLSVRFRRPRNRTPGPFAGYAMEIRRDNLGVGKDATPLDLPFVDDPGTADQIADLRAKRIRTRDKVYDLELGHEFRALERGDAIRLNVPSMGIADVDLEAIQLAKGPTQVTMRGVPTSALDFVYTPRPLPADPIDRTLTGLDIGNAPRLTAAKVPGTNQIRLHIDCEQVETLLPIANVITQWDTLVGAPTHWQAVSDGSDTSYVTGGTNVTIETFRFRQLPEATDRTARITVAARMRSGAGFAIPLPTVRFGFDDHTQPYSAPLFTGPLGTGIGGYAATLTNPFHGRLDFTMAQVNNIRIGLEGVGIPNEVELIQFSLGILESLSVPLQAGYAKYWRLGPVPPIFGGPPAPLETDPVLIIAADLAPQFDTLDDVTVGNVYWYYARIYDEFGRLLKFTSDQYVVE